METANLELWNDWIDRRDPATRNRLVELYLDLVHKIAASVARTLPRHAAVDFDDLVSAGSIGLIRAVERFDPSRGFYFTTFSASRIRGAMLDSLRDADHLSRTVRRQVSKGELAEPQHFRIDAAIADDNWDGRPDRLANRLIDETVDSPSLPLERHDDERELLRGLDKRERLLLLLYYREECTMRSIGDQLGLSESRVSQLHSSLVSRIRARLQIKPPAAAPQPLRPQPAISEEPTMTEPTAEIFPQLLQLDAKTIRDRMAALQRELDLLKRLLPVFEPRDQTSAATGTKPRQRRSGKKTVIQKVTEQLKENDALTTKQIRERLPDVNGNSIQAALTNGPFTRDPRGRSWSLVETADSGGGLIRDGTDTH